MKDFEIMMNNAQQALIKVSQSARKNILKHINRLKRRMNLDYNSLLTKQSYAHHKLHQITEKLSLVANILGIFYLQSSIPLNRQNETISPIPRQRVNLQ